jgi:Domain of unknown function (DUF6265)
MNIIARAVLLSLAAVACGSASAQTCNSLQAVEWLVGEWQGARGESRLLERWQKVSSQTLEGEGTTTRAGKVIEAETLRLVAMQERVFYVAKAAQNELPVAFVLTQCLARQLVFENPQHDFPKKLEYQLTDADTLTVHVSDGAQQGFTLTFTRQRTIAGPKS